MKRLFLSICTLFILLLPALHAQQSAKDIDSPELIVPQSSVPEKVASLARKEYPTLEIVMQLQDSLVRSSRALAFRAGSNRALPQYAVGSIPIQESVSPSGARIYSIPITTAAGYNLTPSVSLTYNSQAGNNVAGYGWGISGLSAITVRNSNIFYDGAAQGGVFDSTTAKYALDGNPLVTSDAGVSDYSLATARGHVLVRKHTNASGQVRYFTALYPDGGAATFGFTTNWSPQSTYPISLLTDKDGNTIHFYYTQTGNYYYINTITYGNGARIDFAYSSRNDVAPYQYSSYGQSLSFPHKLLSGITCRDGSETICEYLLSHEYSDNVSLLTKVQCLAGSEELPPLEFSYGDGNIYPEDPHFNTAAEEIFNLHFTKSDSLRLEYHRGKLIPCNPNDGIVVLPVLSTYTQVARKWVLFHGYCYKYGSAYDPQQDILCNVTAYNFSQQRNIKAEAGFQMIEAVDIDGDGTDELVKINSSSSSQDVTTYKITVYSFDTSFDYSATSFTVSVSDGTHNAAFNNPAKSFYRFGNFRGDGKTMLLIVTKPHSKFALIDLNAGTKVSESSIFTMGDDEDNPIIATDFENDGKTDLCHLTDSGMDIYSLTGTSATSFSLRTTYSGVTKTQLYTDYIDGGTSYQADKARLHLIDLNADGYLDIASSCGFHIELGGLIHHPKVWSFARFNGKGFSTDTTSLFTRKENDSVVFLDVDKDGLPDILHLKDSLLYYVPNENGSFSHAYNYSGVTVDSSSDLIPGDCSLYGTSGIIAVMSGPWTRLYEFSLDHTSRRSLTQLTDSFGNIHTNIYRRTGGYTGAYLIDPGRSYSAASGFSRLRASFNVLYGSASYSASFQPITNTFYTYWDAVYHTRGLGFCGFGKLRSMDYVGGDEIYTILDPEKFGVATSISINKDGGLNQYSTVSNTYDSNTTTYGKLNPRLTQSIAADALTEITTTTTYTYGDYDLPVQIQTSTAIGSDPPLTQKVKRTYEHSLSPAKYVLGVVKTESSITEADSTNQLAWEEKTVYTYDSNYHPIGSDIYVGKNGFERVPKPDTLIFRAPPGRYEADNLVSTTRRTFDSRGNVTSEKTAPYGATEFAGDTLVYDSGGRYLVSKTNALGHTTTYSNYNKFGKPTSVTDYRNRTTTYTYDSWGNLTSTSYPDGGVEQTTTAWGGDGLYTVSHTATGEPETITHYDALGREVKSGVKRFNGAWQWTNREYDGRGRLSRVSLPYRQTSSSGDPSYWNTYHYDLYDRPDTLLEASGKKTIWVYNGTSTTTVKDSVAITKTTDAMGRVVSVSDLGGTTTYTLRDDGQPSSITAPGNVVTTFTYDDYGRQTQMVDPSLGTETDSYTWNADGSSQFTHTNRNGSVTTNRDKYGRVTYVSRQGEFNTTYSYDSYGRLSTVSSTNNTGKEYTYDSYDRISTLKETAPEAKWLQKTYTYSTGSVLSSIAYTSQSGYITTETYTYANGHNTGITIPGAPGVGSTTVWGLVSENDLGQPTQIMSGWLQRQYGYTAFGLPTYRKIDDGYVQNFSFQFDPKKGNLLSRIGYLAGTETFGYDSLNRLTSITKGNTTREVAYESNGNITSIDGVGTLIYGGGAGVSPYEVTGLTPEPGQPSYRQRTVTYNSFDRPETIAEGAYTSGLVYDADGDRVKMYVSDTLSGPFVIRYYIGGRYECDLFSGTECLYLGGDAYSAPMVLIKSGAGGWTPYQIGRDYLGSITDISDLDGQSFQVHYRYDPWGRLVDNSTGQPYAPGSEPALLLGRGYTGHEYLPWFGLINANARLYDPLLGRFLSPDPYVQDPDFSQNYNRYSYCLNNPLKYSDPSGEILTWNIGNRGFSLGLNFGLLGFGVNVGWLDGFSLGIYGELGPRLGGNGLGYGATISQSLDYNFKHNNLSTTSSAGAYASLGCFTASVGVSHTYDFGPHSNSYGWNVGVGMGFGDQISNLGPYVGYGSSGWSCGLSGYYDPKRAHALSKGAQSVGLNANDPVPTTDGYLIKMQEIWYPDAPMDFIDNFTVETVPENILSEINAKNANAQTSIYRKKGELTGRFSVYFSRRAFSSARQLYITMGHEFVHVSNYISAFCLGYKYDQVKEGTSFYEMTEHWAYSYEAQYTGSTVSATDWNLIFSRFSPGLVDLFNYRHMKWYHSRKY